MSSTCFEIDQLGALVSLPEGHPTLAHLEVCPRCRALLLSYREFLAPAGVPDGANLEEAERRLLAALEQAIPVHDSAADHKGARAQPLAVDGADRPTGHVADRSDPATGRPRPADPLDFRHWLRRLLTPAWRPAFAIAASVAIVLIAADRLGQQDRSAPTTLRGGDVRAGEIAIAAPSQALSDGRVRLVWHRFEEATSYRVRLLAADGTEVATLSAGADTTLAFLPSEIRGLPGAGAVPWNVVAYRSTDEIGRSRIGTLLLP